MLAKTNVTTSGVLNTLKQTIDIEIVHEDWKIKKDPTDRFLLIEHTGTCNGFSDRISFIENYFDKLYNKEFTSILCGGLGLGVVPYLVQSFCSKVDVVELSQANIDMVKQLGYLDPVVKIIQGDIKTFIPDGTYDVILLDIWSCDMASFNEEKAGLIEKYSSYLNPGGFLYLPLEGYYDNKK